MIFFIIAGSFTVTHIPYSLLYKYNIYPVDMSIYLKVEIFYIPLFPEAEVKIFE